MCFADSESKCSENEEYFYESAFQQTIEGITDDCDLFIRINGTLGTFKVNFRKLFKNKLEIQSVKSITISDSDSRAVKLITKHISLTNVFLTSTSKYLEIQFCKLVRSGLKKYKEIKIQDGDFDAVASTNTVADYGVIISKSLVWRVIANDGIKNNTVPIEILDSATFTIIGINMFQLVIAENYPNLVFHYYEPYIYSPNILSFIARGSCFFNDTNKGKKLVTITNISNFKELTMNFNYIKRFNFSNIENNDYSNITFYSSNDAQIQFNGSLIFPIDVEGILDLSFNYGEILFPIKAEGLYIESPQKEVVKIPVLAIGNGTVYLSVDSLEIEEFTSDNEFPFVYNVTADMITTLKIPKAPTENFAIRLSSNQSMYIYQYPIFLDKVVLVINEGTISKDQVSLELLSYMEKVHGFWNEKNDFKITVSDKDITFSYGDILSIPLDICVYRYESECSDNTTNYYYNDKKLSDLSKVIPYKIEKVTMFILYNLFESGGVVTISDNGVFLITKYSDIKTVYLKFSSMLTVETGNSGIVTIENLRLQGSYKQINGRTIFNTNTVNEFSADFVDCQIDFIDDRTNHVFDALKLSGSIFHARMKNGSTNQLKVSNFEAYGNKVVTVSNLSVSGIDLRESAYVRPLEPEGAIVFTKGSRSFLHFYPKKALVPMIDLGCSTEENPYELIYFYHDLDGMNEYEISYAFQSGVPVIRSTAFNNCNDWVNMLLFRYSSYGFNFSAKCEEIDNGTDIIVYGIKGKGLIDICVSDTENADKCPEGSEILQGPIEEILSTHPFSILKLTLINQASQEVDFLNFMNTSLNITSNKPIELTNSGRSDYTLETQSLFLTNVSLISKDMSIISTTTELFESPIDGVSLITATLETDCKSINLLSQNVTILKSLKINIIERNVIRPKIYLLEKSNSLIIDGINAFDKIEIQATNDVANYIIFSNE